MKFRVVVALMLGMLVAGCSSSPSRDKVDPKEVAEANADLGLQYMLNGQYEVAMEKLKRALENNSDSVNANHYMAELHNRLGRYDDAERYYRRAVSEADNDAPLNNNYGVFLCGRKKYDQAEQQFLKALENPVYRGRIDTMENIGVCMLDKPDVKKGEEYLRKTLAADPRRPKSLLGMARINFTQGNYMSTRAYLQRYLEVARHTPETLWLGIRTERILGDKDALSSYAMLLKNNFPNAEETRLYLQSTKP
jgi:type IV pilus assembly protein PilF